MTIEFRDPPNGPVRGNESAFWAEVADKCRANPGQWAFVGRHYRTQVTAVKGGIKKAFRPIGTFDARSCNYDAKDRKADIYVRYIGGEAE